jgi:hypothetical protein
MIGGQTEWISTSLDSCFIIPRTIQMYYQSKVHCAYPSFLSILYRVALFLLQILVTLFSKYSATVYAHFEKWNHSCGSINR